MDHGTLPGAGHGSHQNMGGLELDGPVRDPALPHRVRHR